MRASNGEYFVLRGLDDEWADKRHQGRQMPWIAEHHPEVACAAQRTRPKEVWYSREDSELVHNLTGNGEGAHLEGALSLHDIRTYGMRLDGRAKSAVHKEDGVYRGVVLG